MSKITAIILAKNEESMIADCIGSVSFCDEIIVIDNGSTDRTYEIAKLLNAHVFTIHSRNFSELRNYGLEKAKGKWILYVDADERVSEELAKEIKEIVANRKTEYAAFILQRKDFYLGNHEWPTLGKMERLFKKESLQEWYGELHESPRIEGKVGKLSGFLYHYTHRNLTSMFDKTITWSTMEAQLRLDAKHPPMTWWRFPRVMFTAFWNSYVTQKGWKVGTAGLIESMYQAFSMFVTYAQLWEMQQKKS